MEPTEELKKLAALHQSASPPGLTHSGLTEVFAKAAAVMCAPAAGAKQAKGNFRAAYALVGAIKKRVLEEFRSSLLAPFFASLFDLIRRVRSVSLQYAIVLGKDMSVLCQKHAAQCGGGGGALLPDSGAGKDVKDFFWRLVRDGIHALCAGLHPGGVATSAAAAAATGTGGGSAAEGEMSGEIARNFNILVQPLRYYFVIIASLPGGVAPMDCARAGEDN